MSQSINVCKSINCPFWSGDSKVYGCQRYLVSNVCHLVVNHRNEIEANQYALYIPENSPLSVAALKEENNQHFQQDEYYKDKLDFHAEHPDWGGFVPRRLEGVQ